MKFLDCDYVRLDDHSFWILHGYWDLFGTKVFEPGSERKNLVNQKTYDKLPKNYVSQQINEDRVVEHYHPRDYDTSKLKGVWKKFWKALAKVVGEEDVGVFGSQLLGFRLVKDVDFIVYGKENCKKIRENIGEVRSAVGGGPISDGHVEYQSKKIHSHFSPVRNSFKKALKKKWSSIQVREGVLSTVRFAYKLGEVPENLWARPSEGLSTIEGVVVDDFGTSFCPRTFKVKNREGVFTIGTYYWPYHQCVRRGDQVFVIGNKRGDAVTIDTPDHGLIID